jgi:hypothetical protein
MFSLNRLYFSTMNQNANINCYGVLSNAIDEVWAEVLPFVKAALIHGDGKYTSEFIYKCLKNRDMQLWIGCNNGPIRSCVITQILNYPACKRLGIILFGGESLDEYLYFLKQIIESSKELGCESAEIFGRPAWERKLKHLGFKKIQTVFKAEFLKGDSDV